MPGLTRDVRASGIKRAKGMGRRTKARFGAVPNRALCRQWRHGAPADRRDVRTCAGFTAETGTDPSGTGSLRRMKKRCRRPRSIPDCLMGIEPVGLNALRRYLKNTSGRTLRASFREPTGGLGKPSEALAADVRYRIWAINLSAIGVSDWYLFQMRYSFDSSLGVSGRNARPLPGAVSTRCSKESWYPRPSRTKSEAL